MVVQVEWIAVALAFCKRASSSDASSWSKELLPLSRVKAAMFSTNRLKGSGRRAVNTEELQKNVALSVIKVRFWLPRGKIINEEESFLNNSMEPFLPLCYPFF